MEIRSARVVVVSVLAVVGCAFAPAIGCSSSVIGNDEGDSQPLPEVGSGSLYGIGFDSGAAALLLLDPATGAVSKIVSLPSYGVSEDGFSGSAYDPARHRYAYIGDSGSGCHLVTADTSTGAVVGDVALPMCVQDLGIETSSGDVLARGPDDAADHMRIERIDPLTGAVTTISNYVTPPVLGGSAWTVFDGVDNYYTLRPAGDVQPFAITLDRVVVSTGQTNEVAIDAPLTVAPRYDTATNKIYAMSFDMNEHHVVAIDSNSGDATTVATIGGVDHVLLGASAYDPDTHRYFFVGGPDHPEGASAWEPGNAIYTVDVTTGQMLGTSPVIDGQIFELQFAP